MNHSIAGPALLFAALAALPASAQPTATPAPAASLAGTVFEGAVDVQVVNLDVVVSDAHGNLVPGLRREDFRLFEDGRPVDITNFEAIATPEPDRPAAASGTEPSATAPTPGSQRLYLVVFIDNFNLNPAGRNRSLRQVESFLDKTLRPDDRVMIASFDLGLRIRRSFAETARPLADDLRALARVAARGPIAEVNRRSVLRDIQQAGCTDESEALARSYRQQSQSEAEQTVATLRRFVDSLSGLDGKKAILYVSDGFPLRPGEDVATVLDGLCHSESTQSMPIESVANDLHRLTNAANAARVTFYTLEAVGLRIPASSSALDADPIDAAVSAMVSSGGVSDPLNEALGRSNAPMMRVGGVLESAERANLQDTLFSLARETGGRAVLDTNDLGRGLKAIGGELRRYYSLGFSPSHPDDGREHDLKVEVARPGLTVRTRANFLALPAEERRLAALEATLWHGVETNPLTVRLKLGEARPEKKGRFLLPLELKVPLRAVTLVPGEDRLQGRLEVRVVSRDADGRSTSAQKFEIPLAFTQAQVDASARTVLRHEVSLLMTQGAYVVAVEVHDEVGGGTSFLQASARVGPAAPAPAAVAEVRKTKG